ncbi:hypothetical protein SDC9_211805 [bioreactor metagenome]|uniref:Uncharacterized protein n=1 Tax=bioreactor metagenome TaxID=1076179 RepID=A0A645JWK3_9ZZZZ
MRRKPDSIHAQLLQVIQLLDHSFKITNTIPVAIGKTTRIDLVENCFLPPFVI